MGSDLEQDSDFLSFHVERLESVPALSIRSVRGSNPRPLIDDAAVALGSILSILRPWIDDQGTGV